ncbi:MAG TPA: ATP-binding cassette domain-containing protein [Candidatus Thermoplasmatota archaeon]|nr:ATP-binding cassette domain-containing protein [Candidatus Thermoplasmatota archaeon]
MLAFEGVTRVFRDEGGRRVALDDVTFRLAPGTLAALTGENGAGKTTLLRLAATLDEPTRGSVTVDGRTGAEARRCGRRR